MKGRREIGDDAEQKPKDKQTVGEDGIVVSKASKGF
jgi:hypothetical protein